MVCPGCGAPDDQGCYKNCIEIVRNSSETSVDLISAHYFHVTELEKYVKDNQELRKALAESVKLQSHYAGLLNSYDGGNRLQFKTVDDWLKRLQYESYRRSIG